MPNSATKWNVVGRHIRTKLWLSTIKALGSISGYEMVLVAQALNNGNDKIATNKFQK